MKRKHKISREKLERIYGECFDIVEYISILALKQMGKSELEIETFRKEFGKLAAEQASKL